MNTFTLSDLSLPQGDESETINGHNQQNNKKNQRSISKEYPLGVISVIHRKKKKKVQNDSVFEFHASFFFFHNSLSLSLSLQQKVAQHTPILPKLPEGPSYKNLSHWLYGSPTRFPSGAPNSPCSRVHPVPF